MQKKEKRKINFKHVFKFLFIVAIIIATGYLIINMPVRKIIINGNNYIKDSFIIKYLDINSSLFKVNKNDIKDKLIKLDLISSVKVSKNILGNLIIDVTEDKALFYDLNIDKVVLSSGKKVEYKKDYLGIPTLINKVDDKVYDELVSKLNRVDKKILIIVSEIEYSPSIINDKIVDDKRFLFRMNDGNTVYINTINIEKINNYLEIYDAVMSQNGNVTGCLYLDSNSKNKHFTNCDTNGSEEEVSEN